MIATSDIFVFICVLQLEEAKNTYNLHETQLAAKHTEQLLVLEAQLKAKLDESEKEGKKLRQEQESHEQLCAKLRNELIQNTKDKEALKVHVKEEAEKSKLEQNKLNDLLRTRNAEIEKAKSTLKDVASETAKLKAEFEDSKGRSNKIATEMAEKLAAGQKEVESLKTRQISKLKEWEMKCLKLSKSVEEITKEVNERKRSNDDLENMLKEREIRIKTMEEATAKLQASKKSSEELMGNKYSKVLEEKSQVILELKETISSKERKIREYKDKDCQSASNIAKLKEELSTLVKKSSTEKLNSENISNDFKNLQADCRCKEEKIKQLEVAERTLKEEMEKKIEDHERRIEDLTENNRIQLQELKNTLSTDWKAKEETLTLQIDSLTTNMKSKEELILSLMDSVEEKDVVTKTCQELEAKIKQLEEQNENQMSELRSKHKIEKEELLMKATEAANQLHRYKSDFSLKENALVQKCTDNSKQYNLTLESLKNEQKDLISQHNQKIKFLEEKQATELKNLCNNYETKLKSIEEGNRICIAEKDKQNISLKMKYEKLFEQHQGTEEEYCVQVSQLQSDVDTLKEERNTIMQKHQQSVATLQQELQEVNTRNTAQEKKINDITSLHANSQESHSAEQKINLLKISNLEEKFKSISSEKALVDEALQERSLLLQRTDDKLKEVTELLKAKQKELIDSIETNRSNEATLKADYEKEISSYQTQLQKLQDTTFEQKQSSDDKLRSTRAAHERDIKALELKLQEEKSNVAQQIKLLKEKEQVVLDKENYIQTLKRNLHEETTNSNDTLASKQKELDKIYEQLQRLENDKKCAVTELRTECNNLKKSNSHLEKERNQLEKELASQLSEKTRSNLKTLELEEQIKVFKEALQEKKEDIAKKTSAEASLIAKLEEYKAASETTEQELNLLKTALDKTKEANSTLTQKNKAHSKQASCSYMTTVVLLFYLLYSGLASSANVTYYL